MSTITEEVATELATLWICESYRIEGWTPKRSYYIATVSQIVVGSNWTARVFSSGHPRFSKVFPTSREAKAAAIEHVGSLA